VIENKYDAASFKSLTLAQKFCIFLFHDPVKWKYYS